MSTVAPGGTVAQSVSALHLTRLQAATQISSDAESWYENHFHVPASTAMTSLESQIMGQGLQQQLSARFGNAVSDVSFDNASGKWVIDATASPADAALKAVVSEDNLDGDYQVNRVGYSRSDLTDEVRKLSSQLAPDPGFATVGINRGTVQVSMLESASPADIRRIDSDIASAETSDSPPVTTRDDVAAAPQRTVSCSATHCDTLVAGDAFGGDPSEPGGECTMAWYGALTINGVQQPLMLTAGHCTGDMGGQGATVYTNDLSGTVAFGHIYTASFQNGDGDWGYMYVYNPPPAGLDPGLGRPYGGYWNWSTSWLVPLNSYYISGWPAAGTEVCHQGLASGSQCGLVGTGNETVTYGSTTVYDLLEVDNTDACYGDSGRLPGSSWKSADDPAWI